MTPTPTPSHDHLDTTPGPLHPDDQDLVTVAERPDELAASVVVRRLEDAGLQAVAVGGLTCGLRAEAPGWVQVKVLEADADAARGVLGDPGTAPPPVDQDALAAEAMAARDPEGPDAADVNAPD